MTPPPAESPAPAPRASARASEVVLAVVLHPAFLIGLAVWTYLLVIPEPIPEVRDRIDNHWRFIAAKCLHFTAYAALTVLGGRIPFPASLARRLRLGILAFLIFHAVGTEIAQMYVPGRTGMLKDVFIDWGGITTGLLVGWRCWRPVLWPKCLPEA